MNGLQNMGRYDSKVIDMRDKGATREIGTFDFVSFIVIIIEASIGTGAYSHDRLIILKVAIGNNA